MSFGYAIGDFVLLTQLAWDVVQNSRKACGAHDELTSEATSLHIVLRRLEIEVSKPNSILTRSDDGTDKREELAQLSEDCRRVLRTLDGILKKYNALSEEKRSVTKLWKKVQFGNGEMLDLAELRLKIATSTSALTLFLNLLSIGSQGKVESYMESQGDELKEMRRSLNWITASIQAKAPKAGEGSILTTYAGDDKAIWKDFRRELIREGFSSEVLERHMETIKGYVMELGSRGALDDFEDDTNVEETFLEDMSGCEEVEDIAEREHSQHEPQKRLKADILDYAKWSEEHSAKLCQEPRSGNQYEEEPEQILKRKPGDDTTKEDAEHEMQTQTETETQDSSETSTATNSEALKTLRQKFEQAENRYSIPALLGRENISMNNVDGTAVDVNSINEESPKLPTNPDTSTKLPQFNYDPDIYIYGTSESLIGTEQRAFGPYRLPDNQATPWNSLKVSFTNQLFRHTTTYPQDVPTIYRPHSRCYWILCMSRWYAESHISIDGSTYPPNIRSSMVDEFQRLLASAIAYHNRLRTLSVIRGNQLQVLTRFRIVVIKFYQWIRDGVFYMLRCSKEEDEIDDSSSWWKLDEEVYYWHLKEGDTVTEPTPGRNETARSLDKLGTRAYCYFLHQLFEAKSPARPGQTRFADLVIEVQNLLLYFKQWCEEDLLEDESNRTSKLLSPEMSDVAVANAVYEVRMCKLALETWSLQNDYSEDSVKEQRFSRGENSLSAILQRSDESQQKLHSARIDRRMAPLIIALNNRKHMDKKSPDPRSGKKNSKKKK